MSVPNGQITRHTINSRFLKEERAVWVYTPGGFDPEQPYPVLYAHDGEDYLNMGRIRTIVNEQVRSGSMTPIVIVGVPVEKKHRNAEYHPDGDRHEAYTSFFVQELIPFVEERGELHIKVEERATIGSSLGSVVGCQLAWKNPDLFQVAISQSGAFYSAATTRALHSVPNPSVTDYYVMVGTDETDVSTSAGTMDLLSANRKLRDRLQEIGAPCHYEEWEGGHTWGLWQNNLPDALAHFWSKR